VAIPFQSRGPSKPDLLVDARRSHKSSKRGLENGINGKKRKSEKRRARVSHIESCYWCKQNVVEKLPNCMIYSSYDCELNGCCCENKDVVGQLPTIIEISCQVCHSKESKKPE